MRQRLIFLLIFSFFFQFMVAQDCPEYQKLIDRAERFWNENAFNQALNQLSAAREHCPEKSNEIDALFVRFTGNITDKYKEAEREKNRAEAALQNLNQATAKVVSFMLTIAADSIRLLNYSGAIALLHEATDLVKNQPLNGSLGTIRMEVGKAMMESAFYFAETGKYSQAVEELKMTQPLFGKPYKNMPIPTADSLSFFRKTLTSLNSETYQHLRLKYIPDMVNVEGGIFWMGDDEGRSDEKPAHQVAVSNFQIARTELTFWQYNLYLEANGKSIKDHRSPSWGIQGDHPAIYVSWYDAVEYLNWLSEKEGLKPVYTRNEEKVIYDTTANGYRLPTEAEWEFAAGGGLKGRTEEGRRIHRCAGSDSLNLVAWYSGNSSSRTHPVGQKQANELGIYDMSGNVWEWVYDWSGTYIYDDSVVSSPTGAVDGQGRVVRGGSWNNVASPLRVSNRNYDNPDNRHNLLGFRLTRTVKF